jgi:hypothetical protein
VQLRLGKAAQEFVGGIVHSSSLTSIRHGKRKAGAMGIAPACR